MKRRASFTSAGLLLAALLMPLHSSLAQTSGVSPTELEKAVRDYIMKNPHVIRESLEKAELDEQMANTKKVLKSHRADIYDAGSPILGNPGAKITIVEFYDYNCPYCRSVHGKLNDILKHHPDTRILLKDIATFGKESEGAAKVALAAGKQGKFAELHEALMAFKGKASEETTIDLARKLGLNVERLRKEAASPEVARQIEDARTLANNLGVGGTPLLLVGHHGIPGAPDDLVERIEKFLADVRENGCDVC